MRNSLRGLRCMRLLDGPWQQELSAPIFPVWRLLNLYAIANHPKLYLFQLFPPPLLKSLHPPAILGRVWNINNEPHQIVSVKHSSVTPVAFNFLRLVTGRAEL